MEFFKLYTFEATVQVRARITVVANTEGEAYTRLEDGAWNDVKFDTDHADTRVLKTEGGYKVRDREMI